jgi:hypothetical protein
MTWHKGICYPECSKHWGQKHNGKREECSLCKPWLPYYRLTSLPAFRKLREDYLHTLDTMTTKWNVIYTWQGDKMNGGQYDSKEAAETRAAELRADKWNGVRVEEVTRFP